MKNNLIVSAKNSVGPGFGTNPIFPYSLHAVEGSVYRITGMDQISDIIECGYVRPKGYGKRAARVGNVIYWQTGNNNLYFSDKRPVLEVSSSKIKDGQIGAISINDLSAIWIFDEQAEKYINKLEQIKK